MVTETLLGRESEIGVIERALELLEGGEPVRVCVRGEPGIGKTTLLAELGDRAASRGMLVLAGGGAEFERPPPFGAFVDALDDYAGGFDPRRLEDLSAPTLARLASVFPSLAGWAGRSPSDSGHERHWYARGD